MIEALLHFALIITLAIAIPAGIGFAIMYVDQHFNTPNQKKEWNDE